MDNYNEGISQLERGIVAGAAGAPEAATAATAVIKESLGCTTGEEYCEFTQC